MGLKGMRVRGELWRSWLKGYVALDAIALSDTVGAAILSLLSVLAGIVYFRQADFLLLYCIEYFAPALDARLRLPNAKLPTRTVISTEKPER